MLRLTSVMKQLQTLSKYHFRDFLQRFQIHFQCTIIADTKKTQTSSAVASKRTIVAIIPSIYLLNSTPTQPALIVSLGPAHTYSLVLTITPPPKRRGVRPRKTCGQSFYLENKLHVSI